MSETTALLAARSPKLRRAFVDAKKAGHAYVVIDGTLIPVDRVAADRPFYSSKHRRHGMNLQVISAPDGEILWVSGPVPLQNSMQGLELRFGAVGRLGHDRGSCPSACCT